MANRILKDTIWDSSTLAALPDFIEDQFPRWLLLADDWGCFCADAESIKGKVYPKRQAVTATTVEEIRLAYYSAGLLFCWQEGERIWGFWTSFGEHNYLTSVDDKGERLKLRRRTPEPPAELLDQYLKKYGKQDNSKQPRIAPWDALEQRGTVRDKTANPDPDLDPDLDSDPDSLSTAASPKARPPDDAFEFFVSVHDECREPAKYSRDDTAGFVQLSKLRKAHRVQARASPPGWEVACRNYMQTPLARYSLADLCSRYSVFVKSRLDRFGKPPEDENGTNNRRTFESREAAAARKTREASERILAREAERASGGIQRGSE
jgi:hypothetical protein